MKKIIAVLILVVMSLTIVMAQAEVKPVKWGYSRNDDDVLTPFVILESDTGNSVMLFVTKEEQEKLLEDWFLEREKELEVNRSWFEKTVDWITFWN